MLGFVVGAGLLTSLAIIAEAATDKRERTIYLAGVGSI